MSHQAVTADKIQKSDKSAERNPVSAKRAKHAEIYWEDLVERKGVQSLTSCMPWAK
ncbi:hypothetical protein GCM10011517_31490 [Actibacterium pelagium]|uniref:Uncharacterized protein n=1 Tax=Actibacterium pelagium TaxID=2029103 RepID=A0A917AM88_9RHOB|nr:hypothetical protein GCM10011517_31490 [Actibacterium pelagium]